MVGGSGGHGATASCVLAEGVPSSFSRSDDDAAIESSESSHGDQSFGESCEWWAGVVVTGQPRRAFSRKVFLRASADRTRVRRSRVPKAPRVISPLVRVANGGREWWSRGNRVGRSRGRCSFDLQ